MSQDTVQIGMILITLLVAGYAVYRTYQTGGVTLTGVVEEVKEARPIAAQAMEIVQIAVNATEQLKREGSIRTNDEAVNHALTLVQSWLPAEWQVSNEDIIEFINSAVLVASAVSKQAGSSSENDKSTRFSQ